MKKILFWALVCLFTFAFTSCERNNPYAEFSDEDEKIESVNPKDEINYCEVGVAFGSPNADAFYPYDYPSNSYKDFKITYEGGYGIYPGAYLVPQGTSFKVQWRYNGSMCQKTFDVASAKVLNIAIEYDEATIIMYLY